LVVELRNRNLDFGAATFGYNFNLYDTSGAVIASFPGDSFVYPGEVKYLSLLNVALPAGASPSYVRLETEPPQWTPASRFPKPMLTIQTSLTEVANDNLVTRGMLVNQDSVDFSTVYLTALFYDSSGAVVGVSGTERNNVTAGESREFTLFHPIIPGVDPGRTRVFATAFNPR
jgi:hypothetical protein